MSARVFATQVMAVASLAVACASIGGLGSTPSVAKDSPEALTPLALPLQTMHGGKGDADAAYPSDFAVTVKRDGTILFPQNTVARVKGARILVDGEPVLTVTDDGQLKGSALKHAYRFDPDGALLDDEGRGVRLSPAGNIRGVGGEWHWRDVLRWTPEGSGAWDKRGWHLLEIVALVMLENMLPQAIRESSDGGHAAGADAGKGKGLDIHIAPPSEWFK